MNNDELDQVYTGMAQTLTRVGEPRSPLFLSILALSLLSHLSDARDALALMAQAEQASLADDAVANYPTPTPAHPK